MPRIRLTFAEEFKGSSVALLTMDDDALSTLIDQLTVGVAKGLQLAFDDWLLLIEVGDEMVASSVSIDGKSASIRASRQKLAEMLDKLIAMRNLRAPCHQYLEIDGPVKTLVLSTGEYRL